MTTERGNNNVKTGTTYSTRGSLAYKERSRPAPDVREKPDLRVLDRVDPKSEAQLMPATKLALVAMVALVLAMSLFLISRYALLANNNTMIEERHDSIAELERLAEQMEVRLAGSEDLMLVMSEAEKMGLSAPNDEQIVVIDRSATVLNETGTTASEEEAAHTGFLAMVGRMIGLLH